MRRPPPRISGRRNGLTVVKLWMESVVPVVGGVTATLLLRVWTPLPLWACFLIGLPTGTVAGWGGTILVAAALGRMTNQRSRRRDG